MFYFFPYFKHLLTLRSKTFKPRINLVYRMSVLLLTWSVLWILWLIFISVVINILLILKKNIWQMFLLLIMIWRSVMSLEEREGRLRICMSVSVWWEWGGEGEREVEERGRGESFWSRNEESFFHVLRRIQIMLLVAAMWGFGSSKLIKIVISVWV